MCVGGMQAPGEHVECLWARGLTGRSLRINQEETRVKYAPKVGPDLLDLYAIEAELGRGSFGICHAGVHRATGTRCAVKMLRKEVLTEDYLEVKIENDGYSRLLELHDGLKVPHPNVTRYLDILMGSSTIFIVMEPLLGSELFEYIAEHAPVTEVFVRDVTRQALAGLQHVHSVGLIHRDVKLENFKFRTQSPDSELVLLDFGLMCPADPDKQKAAVGTMMYVAPEVFSGWYNTQVDLWSLGVGLYVMLAGDPPFEGGSSSQLDQHSKEAQVEARRGIALQNALAICELEQAPKKAVSLLRGLLEGRPEQRLNATTALAHSWFSSTLDSDSEEGSPKARPTKTATLPDLLSPKAKEVKMREHFSTGRNTSSMKNGFDKTFCDHARTLHLVKPCLPSLMTSLRSFKSLMFNDVLCLGEVEADPPMLKVGKPEQTGEGFPFCTSPMGLTMITATIVAVGLLLQRNSNSLK